MKNVATRLHGFTLIEMMVVLAIVSILVGLAAPSFRNMLARRQADTALTALLTDWRFARAEAIRRNDSVTVCRSLDQRSCGGGGGRWESGWIVFADRNGNGSVDSDEPVLRAHPRLSGIESASFGLGAVPGNAVTYVGSGMAPGVNGRLDVVADANLPNTRRSVCVTSGRVRPNQQIVC